MTFAIPGERPACTNCGGRDAEIRRTGTQDCVYCICGKYQYNAPKTETGREVRSTTTVHNGIKPKQRARVLQRGGGACELCHTAGKPLHVGHIISVADGLELGLSDLQVNSDENLLALCDECNLGMSDETMPLWLVLGILRARGGAA